MLLPILFLLAASAMSDDSVSKAIKSYEKLSTYSVTLRSKRSSSSQIIRYYYKKPGFVLMEFVKPHRGAVLVYNPETKEARLWPFSAMNSFFITLSPDSRLIKSPTGHTVDKSDIGELLTIAKRLQDNGKAEVLRIEGVAGRKANLIEIEGDGDFTVDGIHRYHLWLEQKTSLPLKASSFDLEGNLLEEVLMEDLEVDVKLDEGLFR